MAEQAAGRLKAQELHRLLDSLRDYIHSERAVVHVRKGASDSSGNSVHMDGPAFLAGFLEFLKAQIAEAEAERLLSELGFVMLLSIYVRSGGIKSLCYRLETSCASLTYDYYDNIAVQLCFDHKDGKFLSKLPESNAFLLRHLKEISTNDELRVRAAIAEIDETLLELGRKIEEASLAALESSGIDTEASSDS